MPNAPDDGLTAFGLKFDSCWVIQDSAGERVASQLPSSATGGGAAAAIGAAAATGAAAVMGMPAATNAFCTWRHCGSAGAGNAPGGHGGTVLGFIEIQERTCC